MRIIENFLRIIEFDKKKISNDKTSEAEKVKSPKELYDIYKENYGRDPLS